MLLKNLIAPSKAFRFLLMFSTLSVSPSLLAGPSVLLYNDHNYDSPQLLHDDHTVLSHYGVFRVS